MNLPFLSSRPDAARGTVVFVGAGPGDPELLTLKALRSLQAADVVIHDKLVTGEILDLAPAGARLIDAGKTGFGPSMPQAEINALLVNHAGAGARVIRLKGGDPAVFGRLDEEIEALFAAGIPYSIVPGLTAASCAVASIGQSLTQRGRNAAVRLLTGHDMKGFADHDWRALARPGEVAAIYMGKSAARFLQGRLLMHGADPETPVTIVENVSRPEERILATSLGRMASDLAGAGLNGPALILFGLAPRAAKAARADLSAVDLPAKELA
jgi:uroporphyrin-III C-methyltransferase